MHGVKPSIIVFKIAIIYHHSTWQHDNAQFLHTPSTKYYRPRSQHAHPSQHSELDFYVMVFVSSLSASDLCIIIFLGFICRCGLNCCILYSSSILCTLCRCRRDFLWLPSLLFLVRMLWGFPRYRLWRSGLWSWFYRNILA